jgi:hypothetical protein
VIDVEPSELDEVISVIPAIRPSCLSNGVATEEAIVSGLAPGKLALTEIVGKSTCGNGDTGRKKNANIPAIASAIVSSDVPTGRRTNGVEMLMPPPAQANDVIRMIAILSRNESNSNNPMLERFSRQYLAAVRSTALNSASQRGPSDTPLNIARF